MDALGILSWFYVIYFALTRKAMAGGQIFQRAGVGRQVRAQLRAKRGVVDAVPSLIEVDNQVRRARRGDIGLFVVASPRRIDAGNGGRPVAAAFNIGGPRLIRQ